MPELDKIQIQKELKHGGEWLGAARRWMQSNIVGGDRLSWSSNEVVHIPFCKLEELAEIVAVAAVVEHRKKHK